MASARFASSPSPALCGRRRVRRARARTAKALGEGGPATSPASSVTIEGLTVTLKDGAKALSAALASQALAHPDLYSGERVCILGDASTDSGYLEALAAARAGGQVTILSPKRAMDTAGSHAESVEAFKLNNTSKIRFETLDWRSASALDNANICQPRFDVMLAAVGDDAALARVAHAASRLLCPPRRSPDHGKLVGGVLMVAAKTETETDAEAEALKVERPTTAPSPSARFIKAMRLEAGATMVQRTQRVAWTVDGAAEVGMALVMAGRLPEIADRYGKGHKHHKHHDLEDRKAKAMRLFRRVGKLTVD